jgi:ABC-type uncharacterized transport system permease subunit
MFIALCYVATFQETSHAAVSSVQDPGFTATVIPVIAGWHPAWCPATGPFFHAVTIFS